MSIKDSKKAKLYLLVSKIKSHIERILLRKENTDGSTFIIVHYMGMFHLLYDGLRGFYSELWKRELKSQSPKFTSSG